MGQFGWNIILSDLLIPYQILAFARIRRCGKAALEFRGAVAPFAVHWILDWKLSAVQQS